MPPRRPLDVGRELLDQFDHCCAVTEFLVKQVPPRLWRADPPAGRGRTIAAIVAHIQGVRKTFAKMGGADPSLPSLDRLTSTKTDAQRALQGSRQALMGLFTAAIAEGRGRIPKIPRRTVDMMVYLIQHDAHHRGQISTLLKDLGYAFPGDVITRLWGWRKL